MPVTGRAASDHRAGRGGVRGRRGGVLAGWPATSSGGGRRSAGASLPARPSAAVREWPAPGPAGRAPCAGRAGTGRPGRRPGPGGRPRIGMIWWPSRSGRIFLQLLLRAERGDALLQAVLGPGQPGRLGLVPGGAVGPGEHVQPGQQRPGVPHVAADRGVRPLARAVPVEAQVQRDQGGHVGPPPRTGSAAPSAGTGPSPRRPPRDGGRPPARPAAASASSACRCRAAAPPAGPPGPAPGRSAAPARWTAPARSASAGTRPCAACARRFPAAAWAPRAAPRPPPRCPPAARSRGPGRDPGASISLLSSSRIRSADTTLEPGGQSSHGRGHLRVPR